MSQDLRDLTDDGALDEAKRAEVAIIYKHSSICPVSWSAKREVKSFLEQSPNVPVYVVNVRQDRALSQQLAEELGVQHESPQGILIGSGETLKHASHHQITAQLLEGWVNEAAG